jgi:hypothetical protein
VACRPAWPRLRERPWVSSIFYVLADNGMAAIACSRCLAKNSYLFRLRGG